MFIALMLAGYVATKLNDKKTSEDTHEGLVAAPDMTGEPIPLAIDETDWTLGAEAWVAFPPAGPTL